MIYVNTDYITGKEIVETIGLVRGSTVRSRNFANDIVASLKNLVGGEISEYTKLLAEAREEALQRMIEDAEQQQADAIINIRFQTSNVGQGMAEILAYGTGVKLR
jgi:uncharacterized protein YbjQ (UPF0145 family)